MPALRKKSQKQKGKRKKERRKTSQINNLTLQLVAYWVKGFPLG